MDAGGREDDTRHEMVTGVLRIGTRSNALARVQTSWVATALQETFPDLHVRVVPVTTDGEHLLPGTRKAADWGEGAFVNELEQALLEGSIDLAVHSLKDVPTTTTPGLMLAAIPVREDPRDALITERGRDLSTLAEGARVGTSSVRRAAFLRAVRPDLDVVALRGTADSHYRCLLDGRFDAIVLARAALVRLGMGVPHVPLDPALLPPAAGQGALGLQARSDDLRTVRIVSQLNHPATAAAVRAERELLADLDAGCHLPVAALATLQSDGTLRLAAAVAAPDGSRVLRAHAVGDPDAPEELGTRLAVQLRADGAEALLATSRGHLAHPLQPREAAQ